MKEKLEAVTGDDSRKNSVRSNASSEHGEKRKRSEINITVGGNFFCLSQNLGVVLEQLTLTQYYIVSIE